MNDELEQRLAALEAAVATLTKQVNSESTDPQASARTEIEPGGIDFVLIERLRSRSGEMFDDGQTKGSILMPYS